MARAPAEVRMLEKNFDGLPESVRNGTGRLHSWPSRPPEKNMFWKRCVQPIDAIRFTPFPLVLIGHRTETQIFFSNGMLGFLPWSSRKPRMTTQRPGKCAMDRWMGRQLTTTPYRNNDRVSKHQGCGGKCLYSSGPRFGKTIGNIGLGRHWRE